MDAASVSYMNENLTWFVLETIAWPILAFIAWRFVNDSNYLKEEGVFAPQHILDKMQLGQSEVITRPKTTQSSEIEEK
jgi:hypothetical protein